MNFSFTKAGALLLSMLCFLGISQSQDVLWSEDFGDGLTGWTTSDSSRLSSGDVWVHTTSGPDGGFPIDPIESTTAANGWAIFDSDLYCSGSQDAWLISPTIDLSGATYATLVFEQFFRNFIETTQIEVSGDNGLTWTTVVVNETIPTNGFTANPETVRINIGRYVAGSSTVKIAFHFISDDAGEPLTGCGYAWQVDDVQIIESTEVNLRANTNFYAVAPNAITPKSQVEEFGFVCDIENIGVATATGVNLNISIYNEAGNVVYSEDKTYGPLIADSLAENVLFGSYTPPMTEQMYTAEYTVTSDSVDVQPGNNVITWDFIVSDSVFAKETGSTRDVTPAADNTFSYGNCYYVVNGEDFEATSMSFGVINASEVVGAFVTIKLIKWDGDLDEDGQANEDEYELLSYNVYTFDGSEDDQLITIPISFDGEAIQLEDNSYYILTVEYEDVSPDGDAPLFYLASEEYNYAAMVFRTDSLDKPRYAGMLDVGLTGDFSTLGFGYDIVPVVRLNISEKISSVKDPLSEDNKVSIYPNPVKDLLNLEMDLTETSKEVKVQILDLNGKVLRSARLEDVSKDIFKFSVSDLGSGTYILNVVTDHGFRSSTFMKQ